MIAIIDMFVMHKFSISPYMYFTCMCRRVLGVNFSTSVFANQIAFVDIFLLKGPVGLGNDEIGL